MKKRLLLTLSLFMILTLILTSCSLPASLQSLFGGSTAPEETSEVTEAAKETETQVASVETATAEPTAEMTESPHCDRSSRRTDRDRNPRGN